MFHQNFHIDYEMSFPINRDNFLDFMDDKEVLFTFEKDAGMIFEEPIPWSKKWFLENVERRAYLHGDGIQTIRKFGTIIGLGILEKFTDPEKLRDFYERKDMSGVYQQWRVPLHAYY